MPRRLIEKPLHKERHIIDHFIVVDEYHFLIRDLETVAVWSQLVNRAAGKGVHFAAPQRSQIKRRVDRHLTILSGFDLDIGDHTTDARSRILSIRHSALQSCNAVFNPRFVLVDNRDMPLWIEVVIIDGIQYNASSVHSANHSS